MNIFKKYLIAQRRKKAQRLQYQKDQNELCEFVLTEIQTNFDWQLLKKNPVKQDGFIYKTVNIWKFIDSDDGHSSWCDYQLYIGDDYIDADISTQEKLFDYLAVQFNKHQKDRIKKSLNEIKNSDN